MEFLSGLIAGLIAGLFAAAVARNALPDECEHDWTKWYDKTGRRIFQYRDCKKCGLTREKTI